MKLTDEDKNLAVFTTKYILENSSLITDVYYDEDGDWQFFSIEEVTEEDAKIIGVSEILELDSTLSNLPNLEKGQSAHRTDKNSEWIIS